MALFCVLQINDSFNPQICLSETYSDLIFVAARFLEHHVPDLSLENLRSLIRGFVLHLEEYFKISSQNKEIGNLVLLLIKGEIVLFMTFLQKNIVILV